MAFRVQGIPAVKIVKDGQLAQEFTGALPKEQIEAILRPLVPDAAIPEAQALDPADDLAALGDLDGATRQYENVLQENPTDGPALLGLAKIHLKQGCFETVQELVNLVETNTPEYPQAQALLAQIGFAHQCQQAGGRAACAQRTLGQPDDPEARHLLACCAASEGRLRSRVAGVATHRGKKIKRRPSQGRHGRHLPSTRPRQPTGRLLPAQALPSSVLSGSARPGPAPLHQRSSDRLRPCARNVRLRPCRRC